MRSHFIYIAAVVASMCPSAFSQDSLNRWEISKLDNEFQLIIDKIYARRQARTGSAQEKVKVIKELEDIPNWTEKVWPYVVNLVRESRWTADDEKAYPVRIREANQRLREARDANGGELRLPHPADDAVKALGQERSDVTAARVKLRHLVESLSAVPSEGAVQVIGPLIEASGAVIQSGDVGSPPCQMLAVEALNGMNARNGFTFKGNAPGAKEARELRDALERHRRGESVVLPEIRGGLEDWRQWWKDIKGEYNSKIELPDDLRNTSLTAKRSSPTPIDDKPAGAAAGQSPSISNPASVSKETANPIVATPEVVKSERPNRWVFWVVGISVVPLGGYIFFGETEVQSVMQKR